MLNYNKISANDLKDELMKAQDILKLKFDIQKDSKDLDTNFIYYCGSFSSVLVLSIENGLSIEETNYAIRRWFNYHTSKMAEKLFVDNGATPEENLKNKSTDLYIDGIPFDIKLTVVPALYKETDLSKRTNKDDLIRWLYENQSKEGRNGLQNRIFIVCKSSSYAKSILTKAEFDLIDLAISKFINYYSDKEKNKIEIDGNTVYSDIILVSN